nr:glycoside hydrolase family 3 C-terminal domain-containing protein [Chitinophagaceae bacterium]
MLNIVGAARTRQLQELALKSRLRIPLLFGQDVIHGFRTTFPIPLAEAASWDLTAIERSARIAAIEASASGIHWTFAPMVDIGRDPRWGRVMEGAGEDAYLGSLVAAARVRGFQGKGLGTPTAIMACAKHFAAYGAAVGGRDYNSVDMSERQLRETYLPPFKAALDAGVATFMNSFSDLNGVPATGSRFLQRTLLKGEWQFKGFVVSDWGSVGEMIAHGYASDTMDAALKAITAGSDMDMESRAYINHLVTLVKSGTVAETLVDDAVRRVLTKKFEMGLFENPFRFCNEAEEQKQWNNTVHLEAARKMAVKSIVLLKNDSIPGTGRAVLPLSSAGQRIAFVGPLVKEQRQQLGFWSFEWPDDSTRIASLWHGVTTTVQNSGLYRYAKGCNLNDTDTSGFAEALGIAAGADVVVVSAGEDRGMSGEARSRSSLRLPGVQETLIKRLASLGKPMVVIISAGRPLVLEGVLPYARALVYSWWLGTEAGKAMADVLFGRYNPSGRLPITFPRTEGQIPIYYNHLNTGRPATQADGWNYGTGYIDLPHSPQFAFGYGLGYGKVVYSKPIISNLSPRANETLEVKLILTYSGSVPRTETVQLYLRDHSAAVARPVKELKKFQQVTLLPDEQKVVTFKITTDDLKFYNTEHQYVWEPGFFDIMVGPSSDNVQAVKINWQR